MAPQHRQPPAREEGACARLRVLGALLLVLLWLPLQPPGAHAASASPGSGGARSLPQLHPLTHQGPRVSQLPAGLAPVLRRTLHQEDLAAYALWRVGSSYRATNAAQRLQLRFTTAGPRLAGSASGTTWSWGLTLLGSGRSRLRAVAAGERMATGSELTYHRGSLVEWYRNSPQGLEQGFTLEARPRGPSGQEVRLTLRLTGSLQARLAEGGQALELVSPSGEAVLRYRGLQVRDATGRRLASRLALAGARLQLVLDDRGARYPVRVDPYVQQAKLTASDGAAGDEFGYSVALSGDGSTALVGVPQNNSLTGAAYVFVRSGTTWTQQAKLTASDAAGGDFLGASVALSGDGSTALIGTQNKNTFTGAAYVFVRSGTTWSQQAKLTASDAAAGDFFGFSVALSGDGSTALVGAPHKNSLTGAAYVFVRSGTSWSQQAELTASDGAPGDQFSAVALSGDGSTALVGAPFKNSSTGAAYVFVRSGTTWSQQAELTASDAAAGDLFGYSVGLTGDGSTALAGARGKNSGTGAAYVFLRSGTTWSQQQELTASDAAAGDFFGFSVALSGDGSTALVGAQFKNSGAGAAYVFSSDPSITATGTSFSATEGVSFSGTVASFTDPDTAATASEYSATIDWGDSSSSAGTITRTGPGSFTVSGSHTYAPEATYTVKVTITDTDTPTNTATATSTATVNDVVPQITITMGPQAMEGDLKVAPGSTLKAGFDFTMPGSHPQATVQFIDAQVSFQAKCLSGSGGGTITVPIGDVSYTDPANSSAWFPSGDQSSASVYQGSLSVPNLCSGGQVSLQQGGTFTTGIASTDTSDKVNIRWHYSANGSAGSWSGTLGVIP